MVTLTLLLIVPWALDRPAVTVVIATKTEEFTLEGVRSRSLYLAMELARPLQIIDIATNEAMLFAYASPATLSICGITDGLTNQFPTVWGSKYNVLEKQEDDGRPLLTTALSLLLKFQKASLNSPTVAAWRLARHSSDAAVRYWSF
jgi:hypothetical protein